jgi:hypothetical protein
MADTFDPAFATLFAELAERVSDAGLIEGLPPGGTFELRTINGASTGTTGPTTVRPARTRCVMSARRRWR